MEKPVVISNLKTQLRQLQVVPVTVPQRRQAIVLYLEGPRNVGMRMGDEDGEELYKTLFVEDAVDGKRYVQRINIQFMTQEGVHALLAMSAVISLRGILARDSAVQANLRQVWVAALALGESEIETVALVAVHKRKTNNKKDKAFREETYIVVLYTGQNREGGALLRSQLRVTQRQPAIWVMEGFAYEVRLGGDVRDVDRISTAQ